MVLGRVALLACVTQAGTCVGRTPAFAFEAPGTLCYGFFGWAALVLDLERPLLFPRLGRRIASGL